MKTLKLIIILFIAIFSVSCSKEDDQIYFNKIEETKAEYTKLESEILNLVNEHRANLGLNKLNVLDFVSSVALTHSKYMVKKGAVTHDNFIERQEKLVVKENAKSVAENVGFGFSSAKDVVNAWLKSNSHKEVIENPNFTHFGISIEKNENDRNFFTHLFISK